MNLLDELRVLYRSRGMPTHTEIARKGNISKASVAGLINGTSINPTWRVIHGFVTGLDADPERFRSLWVESAIEEKKYRNHPKTDREASIIMFLSKVMSEVNEDAQKRIMQWMNARYSKLDVNNDNEQ